MFADAPLHHVGEVHLPRLAATVAAFRDPRHGRAALLGLGDAIEVRNLVDDLRLRRSELVLVRNSDRLRGLRRAVIIASSGWDYGLRFGDARDIEGHLDLIARAAGTVLRFGLDDGLTVTLIGR